MDGILNRLFWLMMRKQIGYMEEDRLMIRALCWDGWMSFKHIRKRGSTSLSIYSCVSREWKRMDPKDSMNLSSTKPKSSSKTRTVCVLAITTGLERQNLVSLYCPRGIWLMVVWTSWSELFQDHCQWTGERFTFRCIWGNCPWTHDGLDLLDELTGQTRRRNLDSGNQWSSGSSSTWRSRFVQEPRLHHDRITRRNWKFDSIVPRRKEHSHAQVHPHYPWYNPRWRYPSLSLHGIEGAFSAPGAKTVIPARVIGKFSIRTVPNMDPADLSKLVTFYLEKTFATLKTKNNLKVEELHAGKWWVASPDHWNYRAAAKAVEGVFGVKPDLTREGGSIPVTLTFQDCLGKNVLLLPMGRGTLQLSGRGKLIVGDDGAHSTNEKLDLSNYISGILQV